MMDEDVWRSERYGFQIVELNDNDHGWFSQDGVDRSGDLAIFARLAPRSNDHGGTLSVEERWELGDEVGNLLGEAVSEALFEFGFEDVAASIRVENYQIGPAAESIPSFVVTLWENRSAIKETAEWAQLGIASLGVLRLARRKLEAWVDARNDQRIGIAVHLPQEYLVLLCMDHVVRREQAGPIVRAEAAPLADGINYSFSTPAHPADFLGYLIEVETNEAAFIFVIRGSGDVTNLLIKDGDGLRNLPVPDLMSEGEG